MPNAPQAPSNENAAYQDALTNLEYISRKQWSFSDPNKLDATFSALIEHIIFRIKQLKNQGVPIANLTNVLTVTSQRCQGRMTSNDYIKSAKTAPGKGSERMFALGMLMAWLAGAILIGFLFAIPIAPIATALALSMQLTASLVIITGIIFTGVLAISSYFFFIKSQPVDADLSKAMLALERSMRVDDFLLPNSLLFPQEYEQVLPQIRHTAQQKGVGTTFFASNSEASNPLATNNLTDAPSTKSTTASHLA